MSMSIRDIANLPNAIQDELEYRSRLKAEAMAHSIVNKFTGSNMSYNPNTFNPYTEESSDSADSQHANKASYGSNWGGGGW